MKKSKKFCQNAQNSGIKLKIWLKKINDKSGEFDEKHMKIKFSSDDNFP